MHTGLPGSWSYWSGYNTLRIARQKSHGDSKTSLICNAKLDQV